MNRLSLKVKIIFSFILFAFYIVNIAECYAKNEFVIACLTTDSSRSTDQFIKRLREEIYSGYPHIEINEIDPKDVNAGNHDFTIAIGNRSLQLLLESGVTSPVLAVFISRLSFDRILKKYNESQESSNVTAVFSDPSPLQQLYLIKKLFPVDPRATVIISKRTEFMRNELKEAAAIAAIPLRITKHEDGDPISKTLHKLDSSTIILALPDSLIYNANTVKKVILSAYRNNQSIIGFSRQLVQAGGLATVYTDVDQISDEVIAILNKYIAEQTLDKPKHTTDLNIEINESVLRSFDMEVPNLETLKNNVMQSLEMCCEK